MAEPLTYLQNRAKENWIICDGDRLDFSAIALQLFHQFTQRETRPTILLAEADPLRFLASFIAAVAARCPIFLTNPNWVEKEWQQVCTLVQPDIICTASTSIRDFVSFRAALSPREKSAIAPQNPKLKSAIMIPTGGSSGQIRFAIHQWETLMASVRGFTAYFQTPTVNSFCLLPVYHVSGLMQFLRSLTTGGKLVILSSYKQLPGYGNWQAIATPSAEENSPSQLLEKINPEDFFISLVPTQLNRLLQAPVAANYLSRFKTVLLGGAPAWPELLDGARRCKIALAPTYGMTETASQVVTLKPTDFLAGYNSSGRVLPHAKITICDRNGEKLGVNQIGRIAIQAESLAWGYYGEGEMKNESGKIPPFLSDDLGFFDERGCLNIVGRASDKIITGGENVFPVQVEAAIRATGLVADACAIAVADRDWGQAIAAVYVPHPGISARAIAEALEDKLAKYKRPKYWVAVEQMPRNAQGKVNREQLQAIAKAHLRLANSSHEIDSSARMRSGEKS